MRAKQVGQLAGGVIVALAMLSPAAGAFNPPKSAKAHVSLSARGGLGSFTPAMADPRLTALLSRSGLSSNGLRFTPATTSVRLNRSVTVAVRTEMPNVVRGNERMALLATTPSSIAPIAYNLGVAIGWKRFALSGDVAKVDLGRVGGREAVDLGVSYSAPKWSTRLAVGADRATPDTPRPLNQGDAYSLDMSGSYSLSRRVDLTAGIRYRAAEREQRLVPLADTRRDSQALYIGTAFKF